MILRTAPSVARAEEPSRPVTWCDDPCPLCGRRDEELLFEAADPSPASGPGLVFAVVECRDCRLAYTNPRPEAGSISQFYPADYRPHRRPRKMRAAGNPSWWARNTGRSSPERDGGLPWVGEGRLLDFGCGGGGYLARMAEQGWRVTGLDAALGAVQRVRDLGLEALAGSLPHPHLRAASFDVVTMWHSLEHVHAPLPILREAFRLLVPGGKLIVAVPNRASWAASAFGPAWFGLDLPRHLTHFDPETLAKMLTAAGFRVDETKLVRHSDWLRSSAKLARQRPDAPRWQRALTWKPLAKLVAALAYGANASDCLMAVASRPE